MRRTYLGGTNRNGAHDSDVRNTLQFTLNVTSLPSVDTFYWHPLEDNKWEKKIEPVWTAWNTDEPLGKDCVVSNMTADHLWNYEDCNIEHMAFCQKIVRKKNNIHYLIMCIYLIKYFPEHAKMTAGVQRAYTKLRLSGRNF